MRLKEPLQGLKLVAQGHPLLHLSLLATIIFITATGMREEERVRDGVEHEQNQASVEGRLLQELSQHVAR